MIYQLCFIVSSFSFPPGEGLHDQFANVLRIGMGFARKRDLEMVLFGVAKRANLFNIQVFRESFATCMAARVSTCRLPYPLLMLWNLIVPRGLCPIRSRFPKELGERGVVLIEGIPFATELDYYDPKRTIMSAVDAWSLRQHRLARRSRGWRRLGLLLYRNLSFHVERCYYRRARFVHVVSAVDARYYRLAHRMTNLRVIPVAIEDGFDRARAATITEERTLLFWGDLRVGYLREGFDWFARNVWPVLSREFPALRFRVLGRIVPREWQVAMESDRIEFVGWVERVEDVLSNAAIIVLPDPMGTGLKNRSVTALYSGKPVIGSRYAFEGIPVRSGVSGVVATSVDDYLHSIRTLMANPAMMRRVGRAGRELAKDRYDLSIVSRQWHDLMEEVYGAEASE